jgi:hypothetical protein
VRQVMLVIVLVGAAFLGGAFVNGPGLQWAQTQVLGTLGFNDEIEIASVDLKDPKQSGAVPPPGKPGAAKPKRGEPSLSEPLAPAPTVIAEKDAPGAGLDKSKRRDKSGRRENVGIAPVMLEPTKPTATANAKTSEKSSGGLDMELLPPLSAAPPSAPPTDGSVAHAVDQGKSDPGPAAPPLPSPDRELAPALLGALASYLPPTATRPPADAAADKNKDAPTLLPAPSGDKSSPGLPAPGASEGSGEWSKLGQKMQSLGVTRFSVEGEPGGRVTFSCLIPLAGKQAVSQRFEADGDDLFQAVQATLRRITLWKATQPAETR